MDKLNLIQVFLTVSRSGSFAAASAGLGVDPSTVSKSLSQLEKHLGVRLFNRTTRRLQLTQAGEVYQQSCSHLLTGLQNCEEQLHAEQNLAQGLLRVNLPVSYGQLYIMPMIGRFRRQYPDISLDISLSDDYIDMVGHGIDIAIRSGQLQDSRLVARKLSPMDFVSCAAPALLETLPAITYDNLAEQPWISYRFIHTGKLMRLFNVKDGDAGNRGDEILPESVLVTTDGLSSVKAAIAGVGLTQLPHFLVRDAIMNGDLVTVQPYYRHEQFGIYAYYLNKGYLPAKVRVFLDFVVSELENMGENYEHSFLSQRNENLHNC